MADFIQPAVNGSVTIDVANTTWIAIQETVFHQVGGYYLVLSKPSVNLVELRNLGVTGFPPPGANVLNVGQLLTPSGPIGQFVPSAGVHGYRTTPLTNANTSNTSGTDVVHQNYTGVLTGPVDIVNSHTNATAGDEFHLYVDNITVDAVNNLEIKSGATNLVTFDEPGVLNGFVTIVFTGSIWKIVEQVTTLTPP